jgi:hypothetical protein
VSFEYNKPEIGVADPQAFSAVRQAIESSFAASGVTRFFKAVQSAGLRIRDFESVLRKGILGAPTVTAYSRLGNGDQGQIREFYLASLEKVAPETREKFFKLYAYY